MKLSKIVWRIFFKTVIYVQCYNRCQSKVCSQEFWYILFGLDIQLEESETILHAKNQFKVAKYDESYTVLFNRSIQTHNFVAKVSHIE